MDILTQNQQTVQCEVLTDSGQTLEDSSGHSDTEPTHGTILCMTESGQTLQDCSEYSNTEQADGTVSGTDRKWTDIRRQQWQ